MDEFWQNNSVYRKTTKKIKRQKKENISQSGSQSNIYPNNLGNDIFVSRSGQGKIGDFDSCLNLDERDFIIF